jgi:hypothetical protein
MKTFLFKLTAVLAGLMVALGLAEAAVRLIRPQMTGEVVWAYRPDLGTIPVPNQRGRKVPVNGPIYTFSHNSWGFRGSQEYGRKGAAYRVLLLGDSFTYGVGVNDDQTFAHYLQENFTAKKLAVEVINAGNPGKGTDYELRLLKTWGSKIKPDLVVLCFFLNDFFDNAEGQYYRLGSQGELVPQSPHSLEAKKARVENLPVISWLLSWSQAANLVKVSLINFIQGPNKGPKLDYPVAAPESHQELTRVILRQVAETARSLGSDVLFFYLPDATQVSRYRKTGVSSAYEKDFLELVRSLGEEPHSLTPALAASGATIGEPCWQHWTPEGHYYAALEMGQYIEARLASKKSAALP